MNDRIGLLLFLAATGSLVAAALLGVFASESSQYAVGALLLGAGAASFVFSRHLASTQQRLSEKPFIPSSWNNVRPFTFKLSGAGLVIVGLLFLTSL